MDIKRLDTAPIQPLGPSAGLGGWAALEQPYSSSERTALGPFLSDLGRAPALLGGALAAASPAPAPSPAPAAPVEEDADHVANGAIAAERTLHTATHARGAVTAAARVLLDGEAVEDVVAGGAHNSSVSGKVVAGLGIAGGLAQTTQGVSQLAHGNTVEGAVNVGAGGLTTAAGAMELTAPALVAKRFVPVLAGGAGVVEGVYDLVEGVRKDDGEAVVVGGLKAAGGSMLAAAPFVGGTLVGAPAAVVLSVAGGLMLGGAEIYEVVQHFRGDRP